MQVDAILFAAGGVRDPAASRRGRPPARQGRGGGRGDRPAGATSGRAARRRLLEPASACRFAVDHLVELGHGTIGFLAGPAGIATSTDRLTAMRHAMKRHGLALPDAADLRRRVQPRRAVSSAAAEFVAAGLPATAVVAANDQAAIGFVRGLRARGVDGPGGVSVVGYDDIAPSGFVEPPLTTVHVPLYDLGVRGMRLGTPAARRSDRPRTDRTAARTHRTGEHAVTESVVTHGRDRRPSHREMTNDKENEMTLADDLAYRSATDLAQLIREREVSPVELTDQVIERIEERNPSLNAFVFKGYDDARRAASRRRAGGRVRRPARSAARRADRDQGPVRLQAGMEGDVRRSSGRSPTT